MLIAGDGGHGTGPAKPPGGFLGHISQNKDAFSVVNLLQAGSGGNSSPETPGAAGGSVTKVKSLGYLGALTSGGHNLGLQNPAPESAIIDALLPASDQGVFAGSGGSGSQRGVNGNVTDINQNGIYDTGDGFILAAKFDPARELLPLDPRLVTALALQTRTAPFINPAR